MSNMGALKILALTSALLGVVAGQYGPGGPYGVRGGGLHGLGKQMTDFALNRFLSAVRAGGRGHRELMALTSSQNAVRVPGPHPLLSFGRAPPSITHVQAPPKLGSFYITPPEQDAPFYYGSKRPHMLKLTELKYAQPLLVTAETNNNPQGHQQLRVMQVPVPLPPHIQQQFGQQFLPSSPQQNLVRAPVTTSGAGGASSLQEIIAKAAQEQHASVLQKEQKAHPDAQINSQILVPGQTGETQQELPQPIHGVAGRQPVFVNQFGQPFLAPAIYSGQGAPQLQYFGGPQPQSPPQGPPQGPQQGPPPQFLSGQPQGLQGGPPLQYISLNSISGEIPRPRVQKRPQQPQPGQGGPFQLLPSQAFSLPPGANYPGLPGAQDISSGQVVNFPAGAYPQPYFPGGQLTFLNQQAALGFRAQDAGPGAQQQFIPGNAILGQPHYAFVGSPELQGQNPNQAAGQQGATKEEQPTRPQETAASQVNPVTTSLGSSGAQVTAAIMQSQAEFSEPITKL